MNEPALSLSESFREIRRALHDGDSTTAEMRATAALSLYPHHPTLLFLRGVALRQLGQTTAAENSLRAALAAGATDLAVVNNLALLLASQGRHGDAVDLLRDIIAERPHPELYHQLATSLQSLRRLEEAAQALRCSAVLDPSQPSTMVTLGNLYMIQGDLPRMFRCYRHRLDQPEFPWQHRAIKAPHWKGQPLAGRRLLVHAERDFGDTIQFLRFVPLIEKSGGRVLLEIQPQMARLAASLPGIDQILVHGDALPEIDYHIPLPDLPIPLAISAATWPDRVPYLQAPTRRVLPDRQAGELRLGVVWSGRRGDGDRDIRHCRAADLAPLATIPGVRLVSLQIGATSAELNELAGSGGPILDATPQIRDFADTASLLMELDALVTIDTAIAHLGGALGRPVLLLHHSMPAVRWHFHALHRPFYPTVTLVPPAGGETWEQQVARLADLIPALRGKRLPAVLPSTARRVSPAAEI